MLVPVTDNDYQCQYVANFDNVICTNTHWPIAPSYRASRSVVSLLLHELCAMLSVMSRLLPTTWEPCKCA